MSDLEKKIASMLDDSVEQLDPAIERRLKQARYAALAAADKPATRWLTLPNAALASVMVVTLVVTVMMNMPTPVKDSMLAEISSAEELAVLDNLELLEDLEFMQWLEENGEITG